MPHDQTRVHQRVLGYGSPRRDRPGDETVLSTRLNFCPEARQALRDQLDATGEVRGGPLFGHRQSSDITIVAAPLGGYRVLDPSLATDPLRFNSHYLLGWIDSLNHTSAHHNDWVGTWVMWPNSLFGPLEDEMAWLRRGRETDLFSARHCLCTLGWADGVLSARCYTWNPVGDSDIQILSTNL